MAFRSEEIMRKTLLKSPEFSQLISSEIKEAYFHLEPKGLFGVPDLVVVRLQNREQLKIRETFAFELKLENWKRALTQAYRYRSFANRAFVIMDASFVNSAVKNIERFKKSGVGLIGVDHNGSVSVFYFPPYRKPFSKQLKEKHKELVASTLPRNPFLQAVNMIRLKLIGYKVTGIIPLIANF